VVIRGDGSELCALRFSLRVFALNSDSGSEPQVLYREALVDELLERIDADLEVVVDVNLVHGGVALGGLDAIGNHGTRIAFHSIGTNSTSAFLPEVVMANETELFYLILLVVLTLIMHGILVTKGWSHGDKKS